MLLFCALLFEAAAAEAEVAAYLATMLFLLIFCCFSSSEADTVEAIAGGLLGFFEVVVVMANDSRDECLLLGVAFKVIVSFAKVCGKREKIIYQSTYLLIFNVYIVSNKY